MIVKKNGSYWWYKAVLKKITRWLISSLGAQFLALITCLPILVMWGLPISLMSIIGNIVFAPFFGCFLLISSLVFFTELFLIPNKLLIQALSLITTCWQYLLCLGKKEWLIGFIPPHPTILLIMPLALWYYLLRKNKHMYSLKQLGKLCFACMLSFSLLYAHNQLYKIEKYKKSSPTNSTFTCFFNDEYKLVFIDDGYFSKKRNVEKAVEFQIKPHILKTFGTTHFAQIILSRVNGRSLTAAYHLALTCPVETIVIPYFKRRLCSFGWFCYFRLRDYAEKNNIQFIRAKPCDIKKSYRTHSS